VCVCVRVCVCVCVCVCVWSTRIANRFLALLSHVGVQSVCIRQWESTARAQSCTHCLVQCHHTPVIARLGRHFHFVSHAQMSLHSPRHRRCRSTRSRSISDKEENISVVHLQVDLPRKGGAPVSILSPGQTRAKRTTGKQGLRYTPRPEAPHYYPALTRTGSRS
jgi:hypothetical protein